MEDVLDVYQRPYDPQIPKICMDEGSKQLLAHTRQPIQMEAGEPERVDYEYERKGVCSVFLAMEPETGACQVRVSKRRTKKDWALFLRDVIDLHYPHAEKIVLVMDNLNTHRPASLYEAFPPDEARRLIDKLEIHYTPKHGSWLNIAEIELGILSRQCLARHIPSANVLQEEVAVWQRHRNRTCGTVDWQFTTKDARIKLKRLYPSTQK
jgi:hypothetical protein